MSEPVIYIGKDPRDELAYQVAVASIRRFEPNIRIIALRDWELRHAGLYNRPYHVDEKGQKCDDRDQRTHSTEFQYTRFLVPHIHLNRFGGGWAMFVDPDVMFRASPLEVFEQAQNQYQVMCVKHEHNPTETTKIAGLAQTNYLRKNWSSMMLLNTSRILLQPAKVNNWHRDDLQALGWADEKIGALPEAWNYLVYPDKLPDFDVKMAHFTIGTPDLPHMPLLPFEDEWRELAITCDAYNDEGAVYGKHYW